MEMIKHFNTNNIGVSHPSTVLSPSLPCLSIMSAHYHSDVLLNGTPAPDPLTRPIAIRVRGSDATLPPRGLTTQSQEVEDIQIKLQIYP